MTEIPELRWSGAYAALPPASMGVNNLSGDKIILPQSALEQLLAAAPSRRPAGATFAAADPINTYMRSGALGDYGRDEDSGQQLPHPLMFRLVNTKSSNAVYAGIREFSAPEGTLCLSPFLLEALDVKDEDLLIRSDSSPDASPDDSADTAAPPLQIAVHAVQLPKGTYVRLRPLEAGYNPGDWKWLLERHLRENYTCLTKDTILLVNGVQGESFKFLVDKIAPEGDGICVVDTDLEVDIEALDEEQARETLRQIASRDQAGRADGSSKGGHLDIWKDAHGQVSRGDYVDYVLPSWDRSQPLTITLSGIAEEEALDLFVTPRSSRQRALPRESEHVFGSFDAARHGTKSISISPANVEMEGAESVMVSVHGHRLPGSTHQSADPVSYTIRAKAGDADARGSNDIGVDSADHGPDDEQCKNCLQWVPKRTMVLHENFCRRNNIICSRCQAVFKKGSPEWGSHWHCDYDDAHGDSAASKARHDQVFHMDRPCPLCTFSTNSTPDLARHRTTVCPGKLILCRFCHLEVPQEGDPFSPAPEVVLSGMTAHELADGARTTECHLCDKIVRLRDMETHLRHHELDKAGRPEPAICRNANCGRTLHGVGPRGQVGVKTSEGQGPGNDLGLCSLCFGPLYASMYDPDGKALRRRIERRYLQQLMTGCGKAHCANDWCKAGRAKTGLEAKGSSARAALPLVKPLLEGVADHGEPMFFCVDELSQKRRRVAEMVAAEKVWSLAWCVAAAEAERGDAGKMRDWLQAWAPRR